MESYAASRLVVFTVLTKKVPGSFAGPKPDLGRARRSSFEDYLAISRRLHERGIDYRRMGAAAVGLVRVADGIADLYYERHLKSWEMLAGALFAHEAGGRVFMPPLAVALADGGPVIAGTPGLDAEFAFLRDTADVPLESM